MDLKLIRIVCILSAYNMLPLMGVMTLELSKEHQKKELISVAFQERDAAIMAL